MEISNAEREIMQHALGTRGERRNHFVTSPDCSDGKVIAGLIERGLMYESMQPSALTGGDHCYSVTDAGRAALKAAVSVLEGR